MKKYFMMLAAFASAMVITSCASSEEETVENNNDNEPKETIIAVGTPGSETRAVVGDGQLSTGSPRVDWEDGDEVALWAQTGNNDYYASTFKYVDFVSDNVEYHGTAYFKGLLKEAPYYYAMYPSQGEYASMGNAIVNNETKLVINATIPTTQYARANSFDPKAAICCGASSTAPTETKPISLFHACAYLKITVPKATSYIKISGAGTASTWLLSGKVQVLPASEGTKVVGFSNGFNYVQLYPQDGASSFAAGTYLIAVASSTKFPGLKIEVHYADNTSVTLESTDEIQFNASGVYNLGTAATESYTVTCENDGNGTVSSNTSYTVEGKTVTLTVTPKDGFIRNTLTVTKKNAKEGEESSVEVHSTSTTGVYTFTMPADDVTVNVTFVENK